MHKIILSVIVALTAATAYAQSGTNSPYSQYGLGTLTDQGTGLNRAMNGVGIAFHDGDQANYLNPASFAGVDSLTFIFDTGLSLQLTNFNENGKKVNARTANFDYAVAAFRILKNLGGSFGIIPFSNVGYSYGNTDYVDRTHTTTYTYNNDGSGGIHQIYVGAGYSPLKGLRVGANVGYVWGNYLRSVVNTYSNAEVTSLSRSYTGDVKTWKLDLGVQYTHALSGKDNVTLGATYSPGHTASGDAAMTVVGNYSNTVTLPDAYFLPTQIGVGASWYHGTKWHVGADYTLQKWSEKPFPDYNAQGFAMRNGVLSDRQRIALGGEYVANAMSRSYLNRVRVRGGLSYATPYVKVAGKDGPKELSASLGVGLPITNSYNNRSILNISAQWVNTSATGFIKENTFRINVGLTFNERWFMKWKVE